MSILRAISGRETSLRPEARLRAEVESDSLIERLILERRLEGHDGCVNTVSFNPSGDLLVSGSDDTNIIMWDWQTGKQRFKFDSGHHNNVFQARILPHSNDKTIVSCAADGQVRASYLGEGGQVRLRKMGMHAGRAHKLALQPDTPQVFMSCGEDGEVKWFDLRETDTRHVRKMIVSSAHCGGHRAPLELNAVTINPSRPWLWATCGTDQYTRVYDSRALPTVRGADGDNTDARASSKQRAAVLDDKPVFQLCPSHLLPDKAADHGSRRRLHPRHITCVMYSKCGELLATYSSEDIYLFEPVGQEQQRTRAGGSRGADMAAAAATAAAADDDDEAGDDDEPGPSGSHCLHSGLTSTMEDMRQAFGMSHARDVDDDDACPSTSTRSGNLGSTTDHVVQRYSGHRNSRTVKGVNFFGTDDEYVISGSDCGHIFFWGKQDGCLKLLQHGDEDVVNCLEPHPWHPLTLVTSGIDYDIKVWSPHGASPVKLDPEKQCKVIKNNIRGSQDTFDRRFVVTPELFFRMLEAGQRIQQLRRARTEAASRTSASGAVGGMSAAADEAIDNLAADEDEMDEVVLLRAALQELSSDDSDMGFFASDDDEEDDNDDDDNDDNDDDNDEDEDEDDMDEDVDEDLAS